jgi:hypothetical protein
MLVFQEEFDSPPSVRLKKSSKVLSIVRYRPPDTSCCLCSAKTERTLKTYQSCHKKLRLKFAEHHSAKDMNTKNRELNTLAHDVRQRLQEFGDMERLPRHCELC